MKLHNLRIITVLCNLSAPVANCIRNWGGIRTRHTAAAMAATGGSAENHARIKIRAAVVAEKLAGKGDKSASEWRAAVDAAMPHAAAHSEHCFTVVPVTTSVAKLIDHTVLKAVASASDVDKLCKEALEHGFAAVCVNGSRAAQAAEALSASAAADGPRVAAVVGFPLGATLSAAKASEAAACVQAGCAEIDMVTNVGQLLEGDYAAVLGDYTAVVDAVKGRAYVKVILETCYLDEDRVVDACILAVLAGAHCVKTSTGFGTGGAQAATVRLMKETVGDRAYVKASGGIRTAADAATMVANGAARLGCSAGVAIVQDGQADSKADGY